MKLATVVRAACLAAGMASSAAVAADVPAPDPFLDLMQGRWDVGGTYKGHPADHNFKAEWTFRNGYLRFRDVSEEENAAGLEELEVIAYIGYDAAKSRYVCVWLDNSGTADPETVAAATPRVGDTLPFVFKTRDGGLMRATFAYDSKSNTWSWTMDTEKDGTTQPIARLKLWHKKK